MVRRVRKIQSVNVTFLTPLFPEKALFKPFFKLLLGDSMAVKRTALMLRLRPEDREVIRQLAKYYDIAEADVVKILIREYLKNHNIGVGSSSS